jgi:DNA replication protein DnaC
MLINQTIEGLLELRLNGMADALRSQLEQVSVQELSFDERLGLLVDAELSARQTKKLKRLLDDAKLKEPSACLANTDYAPSRGVGRAQIMSLATCHWVDTGQHVIITGATGVGKTWLACAIGHQVCLRGKPVRYLRAPRLLEQLSTAQGDGSLSRFRAQLARASVLILDDWLMAPLDAASAREILELVDDRTGKGSLVITSQHPVETWHDRIGEPTVADAILDRIIHSAHRIKIGGESIRKLHGLEQSEP